MAIKGNIVKKEKSVLSFTFNGGDADGTLRATEESIGINKGCVPSLWKSQEKYLKNDIVCSSTSEGIKLYRALKDVFGDTPPDEDAENWELYPYQFFSDFAKKAKYDALGNEISESYVTKEEGKGLSENNFTDEYINKIEENESDISEIKAQLGDISDDIMYFQSEDVAQNSKISNLEDAVNTHRDEYNSFFKEFQAYQKSVSKSFEPLGYGIKPVSCSSEEEVAELAINNDGFNAYRVTLTITTVSQPPMMPEARIETFLLFNDLSATETKNGIFTTSSYEKSYSQLKLSNDGIFKRTVKEYNIPNINYSITITDWEEIYDLVDYAKTEELSAYALKTELSDYVKKEDFRGANSLSYFFANNYNNGLFGSIETKGALFADYIFKENSMSDITVDLSAATSMIGGFLNAAVENVSFTNGTADLKKATSLFKGCKKLESVTGLDLGNSDSVKYLFMNCENMAGTVEIETQATDLSYMLYGCKAITGLKLKATNATLMTGCFTNCDSLNSIEILGDMDFEVMFKALLTVENGTITTTAEISDEIKAIATEKGWSFNE